MYEFHALFDQFNSLFMDILILFFSCEQLIQQALYIFKANHSNSF